MTNAVRQEKLSAGTSAISDPVILFAEDDQNDAFFFQRAIEKAGISYRLMHVSDGEDAINYLKGEGIYADRARHPFPSVLITDLKMPRATGFDVLAWMKGQLQTDTPRAIVLSGSSEEMDKQRAFALGAQAYWVKPVDANDLVHLASELKESGCFPSAKPGPPPQNQKSPSGE